VARLPRRQLHSPDRLTRWPAHRRRRADAARRRETYLERLPGRLWVTEWYAGKLARYEPDTGSWREWRLPGSGPQPYAVYVDEDDIVWITDFGANALVRFDPRLERFRAFPFPTGGAEVRQLLGRLDEIWGAESGTDKIVVLHTG
jgi:virginiamycin B lyase